MSTKRTGINYLCIKRNFVWVVLLIVVFGRHYQTIPKYQIGDRVRVSGRLMTEPIRYSTSQYLRFSGIKIYLPSYPEVTYGDYLIIEGVVGKKYLENPILVSRKETRSPLFVIRKRLIYFYQKAIPEPHSALVAGITLGAKTGLPEEFWQVLKNTGTAHVVVASGMNVAMTAGFVLNLLMNFISRKKAAVVVIISIWIYTLISGFDAPIVRAAIMGSIAFGAQGTGRVNEALRALFMSALLMLIINPRWLTDLGFILSFLATGSLVLFEGKIQAKLKFLPNFWREGLATSLAAQIGVAPVIYYVFGQFNIFSPVINALILWTIAPIMVIGAVAGTVGLILPLAGSLVLLLVYPLTSWFIFIITLCGGAL